MRTFLLCAILIAAAASGIAQAPSFANQQQTSGVVGLASGQTARLNVLYPTAPAPILQVQCSANLVLADDQDGALKSKQVEQLIAGRSVSLDVNADTDLAGAARTQVHGFSVAPGGCRFVVTLEIIDNATQRTVLVVGSKSTYPPPASELAAATSAVAGR